MHIQLPQPVFLEKVSKLQSVVEKGMTRPILANILIEAKKLEGPEGQNNGTVTFIGTDLDIGIKDTVLAEVIEEGSITAPARKLYESLQVLPALPVTMIAMENRWLDLRCGNARLQMMALPADRYPGVPDVSTIIMHPINSKIIATLVKNTSYATSHDTNRPTLNGVFFKAEPTSLRMVATDGHRLALCEIANDGKLDVPISAIISNKMLAELSRFLGKGESEVHFGISESMIVFCRDQEFLIGKLINGEFPNYRLVIPTDLPNRIVMNRSIFLSAVLRVKPFTESKTPSIKMRINENVCELSATSAETGSARDELGVEYAGAEVSISFNAEYLTMLLKAIEADFIEMLFVKDDEPVIVKPIEEVKTASEIMHLIMPLVL